MSRYITESGRIRNGRGRGRGSSYSPYITGTDFPSVGTASSIPDPKTGRMVECLSQVEADYWHMLWFRPDVVEIREQVPLDKDRTNEIAKRFGVNPPYQGQACMTSDFLIDFADGHQEVHSVKYSAKSLENKTTAKYLVIEQEYWESQGIMFRLVYKSDINRTLVKNIRFCRPYYRIEKVRNESDYLKHLIITHKIPFDMENRLIDIGELADRYREVLEVWRCQMILN